MSGNQEGDHYRQWLNNLVRKHKLGDLLWESKDHPLANNGHIWTATVSLGGTTYGVGEAAKKAEAQEKAAKVALATLEKKFGVQR